MPVTERSTLIDIAFDICAGLDAAGIVAVLSGTSAAAFYTEGRQRSDRAEFSTYFRRPGSDVRSALASMAFVPAEFGAYAHARSRFRIRVLEGPVVIGRAVVEQWLETTRNDVRLYVMRPEDVVCERFLKFWKSRERLARDIALDVARRTSADLGVIDAWAEEELVHNPAYERHAWEHFRADLRDPRA